MCGLYVCVYEDDIDKHGYTYKLDRYGYYTYIISGLTTCYWITKLETLCWRRQFSHIS